LDLAQQAIEILRANDRGGYTVPTAAGLYPAQWNWDSCLVALGLAQFDEPRAVVEIETLFGGQWPDGMVPHILFHGDDSTYFPNASVWQAGPARRSSGITQPLVAATVVRHLFDRAADPAIRARLTALVPKLLAWHRWCYAARDPYGTGLVSVIHPWESGMDNSPVWDDALLRWRLCRQPSDEFSDLASRERPRSARRADPEVAGRFARPDRVGGTSGGFGANCCGRRLFVHRTGDRAARTSHYADRGERRSAGQGGGAAR
jgi:hypothetical protein